VSDAIFKKKEGTIISLDSSTNRNLKKLRMYNYINFLYLMENGIFQSNNAILILTQKHNSNIIHDIEGVPY